MKWWLSYSLDDRVDGYVDNADNDLNDEYNDDDGDNDDDDDGYYYYAADDVHDDDDDDNVDDTDKIPMI